ncbi:MAG: DEDD-Tnp-IS110 domain-containing protein [Xylanivirga thermophila]|jgi:transposase|uniref:IS110 family transposase n=2 Tax=Xylanivirga thermophila TaxID=2496273 RepID=UPI0039F4BC55
MNFKPIAGIDVGKFFSEMAILSPSNKVVARMKINHDSYTDVKRAIELLKKAEKDFDSRPSIVMESTGHYHKILFHSLCKFGFEVSIINPIQTDSIKNIGIRKVKNDKIDAQKIALLHRFQELETTNIPNEDIECLKSLCRQYYKLSDELTTYKNRLTGIVDQLMLNFKDVFPDIYSKTAIAVLAEYPTPTTIIKADKDKLVSIIKGNSRKSLEWATAKYELLVLKAKEFEPLSVNNTANVTMLTVYISMVKNLQNSLTKILKAIHQLIDDDLSKDVPVISPTLELLQSIPGIGFLTAATIIAEIGDFSAFSKPKKLVAYFGIDPSVMQSGEFTGTRNKMSKRGSKLLRRVLYTTALANIRTKRNSEPCNPVLMDFYKRKSQSKPKKVALGAVMHKLVYIIFAVLRDRKPFELRTPEEHAKMLTRKHTAA